MLEDQDDTQEEEAQRKAREQLISSFLSPIGENLHYPCLFTRRYIKSKKKYQYYLYSSSEDFLFCVASSENNEQFFSVSMNANQIANKDWQAGSLQGTQNHQFTGISFHHNESETIFRNSIRIDLDPNSRTVNVKIPPPGQMKFIFVDGNSSEYKPLSFTQTTSPHFPSNYNNLHFNLEFGGYIAFTITQVYQDEFKLQGGYPFSLFQVFCICLAAVTTFTNTQH